MIRFVPFSISIGGVFVLCAAQSTLLGEHSGEQGNPKVLPEATSAVVRRHSREYVVDSTGINSEKSTFSSNLVDGKRRTFSVEGDGGVAALVSKSAATVENVPQVQVSHQVPISTTAAAISNHHHADESATEEFNCLIGGNNMEHAWSEAKKDWCCTHKNIGSGCTTTAQPTSSSPPPVEKKHGLTKLAKSEIVIGVVALSGLIMVAWCCCAGGEKKARPAANSSVADWDKVSRVKTTYAAGASASTSSKPADKRVRLPSSNNPYDYASDSDGLSSAPESARQNASSASTQVRSK